jgi:hypothetical protein
MPDPKPNLKLDVDALFEHLTKNLGHDIDDEKDWVFTFRSDKVAPLEKLADELSAEFEVDLQEEVETIENDRSFMGPPMLSVLVRNSLRSEQVKSISIRFENLAKANKVTYEGVACYDPSDDDEEDGFDWLSIEEAKWQLRHFTDSGMPAGEELRYVFGISASDQKHAQKMSGAIKSAGFEFVEVADDDEGGWGVIVVTDGSNDEKALVTHWNKVSAAVTASKGELLGVQFDQGDDEFEDDGDEE